MREERGGPRHFAYVYCPSSAMGAFKIERLGKIQRDLDRGPFERVECNSNGLNAHVPELCCVGCLEQMRRSEVLRRSSLP